MQKTLGMKFDSEKPRMGLLPPYALESVAEVLTFGAKKYLPHNWKYVEDAHNRYIDAAMRHINAYIKGEKNDPESGFPHMSHAICCLMFIADLDLVEAKCSGNDYATIDNALQNMIRETNKENYETI